MKLFSIRNLFAIAVVLSVVVIYINLKDISVATNKLGNDNNIATTVLLVITILLSVWLVYDNYKFILSYK